MAQHIEEGAEREDSRDDREKVSEDLEHGERIYELRASDTSEQYRDPNPKYSGEEGGYCEVSKFLQATSIAGVGKDTHVDFEVAVCEARTAK